MKRLIHVLCARGIIASIAIAGLAGCGSSKLGVTADGGRGGTGGGGSGTGGSGAGGTVVGGGGTSSGIGGVGAGGLGAGGVAAGGAGGKGSGGSGTNASGGILGSGGSGAGGDTKLDAGCAPGWTICCGQCLSPQAGICAPCSGTGGRGATGGVLGTGGRGGAGAGGGGAGGVVDASPLPDAGMVDAGSGACSTITTRAACDNRSDCHSVFVDNNSCDCAAAGCCAQFNRCADGGRANCNGQVSCGAKTPYCAGPYVVSYTTTCFEGCVLQSECAGVDAAVTTPTCPQAAPGAGSSCGSASLSCFYDGCPSTGRTQATCTSGQWVLQTGACGTVSCLGVSTGTTCASGEVCLVRAGGALMVSCISNGCGTGPASADCSSFTTGCNPLYSVTSGVTYYCNTCPQGGCP